MADAVADGARSRCAVCHKDLAEDREGFAVVLRSGELVCLPCALKLILVDDLGVIERIAAKFSGKFGE